MEEPQGAGEGAPSVTVQCESCTHCVCVGKRGCCCINAALCTCTPLHRCEWGTSCKEHRPNSDGGIRTCQINGPSFQSKVSSSAYRPLCAQLPGAFWLLHAAMAHAGLVAGWLACLLVCWLALAMANMLVCGDGHCSRQGIPTHRPS